MGRILGVFCLAGLIFFLGVFFLGEEQLHVLLRFFQFLHKAAKAAFDETSLKKLPKVKELDAEYAALLSQKKATYPAYRKARDEMQELKKAQKNVELFFAEEKDPKEKSQTR